MLEYRIRKGTNTIEKSPVIFLIHGYGSHADDLFSFAPYLPQTHTVIALQAPLVIAPGSYAWYPLYPKEDGTFTSELEAAWSAVDILTENIDLLVEKYGVNPIDISILGFSQGAILSWALAFSKPKKIRRIVALSGMVHESVDTSQPPTFLAYAAHGISDVVIPVEKARTTILPLSEKYNEIEYHEFPEGHSVSQENFTRLLGWLEKTEL
jgi:phospholipase/carboxylesterase